MTPKMQISKMGHRITKPGNVIHDASSNTMGTTAKEPRRRIVTVRLTDREELTLQGMMKDAEYLSMSRYIRDRVLDTKTARKSSGWDPRDEIRKLVAAVRRIGESYNQALDRFGSQGQEETLLKTLAELTRDVKKKTDRIIDLLVRTGQGESNNSKQQYIMLQKIEIIGSIVADAELKTSRSGNEYTGFRVMVSETFGDEKRTTFYDVAFSRNGLVGYLKKGRQVYVSGRLSLSAVCRDGKAYLNAYITANDVELCGSREG